MFVLRNSGQSPEHVAWADAKLVKQNKARTTVQMIFMAHPGEIVRYEGWLCKWSSPLEAALSA